MPVTRSSRFALASVCASIAVATAAHAGIVGFTEDFSTGPAQWRDFGGVNELQWFATGGATGGAYASALRNLSNTSPFGFPATLIRAHLEYGSSGGAYAGNWLAAGVWSVSFDFRHDLPEPIQVTGRFASPTNNPGASVETSTFVLPNVWTRVTFLLTPDSPDFVSFGSGTYESVFSNIGNIQIGFNVPFALAGQDITGRFDIDNFSIIPAPAAFVALAGLGLVRRRRRAC